MADGRVWLQYDVARCEYRVERATVCGAQRIGAAAIAEWPCRCAGDGLREKTEAGEMERRGWTGKRGYLGSQIVGTNTAQRP